MSFDYDAVVVGARVAGASTAMLLARYGHNVLLIDRATMPSDTVSTHAILRSGVLQLQRWGMLDSVIESGAPPIRDVTLGFDDERIQIDVRPDYGVEALAAPRRYVIDNLLVEAAVGSGAEFRSRDPRKTSTPSAVNMPRTPAITSAPPKRSTMPDMSVSAPRT